MNYTGVSKSGNKYRARVHHHDRMVCIGSFETKETAAAARDEYITRHNLWYKRKKNLPFCPLP